ncbi:hypothetical protein E3O47_14820 [Cryobacterium sp. TMT2-17-1]|uniref:hypothetical protein n=1 Tax=Cryobacterium sp. TMT2-17-1 TaxID=1259248 RepID=UPI00106D36E4|nr:hypothetical protein [Cryobacterium sp. TMT2-17-1]TFC47694.1 hypothetical protein E3O47_14820 [Cryobacterium sp. TMT2-17-1]
MDADDGAGGRTGRTGGQIEIIVDRDAAFDGAGAAADSGDIVALFDGAVDRSSRSGNRRRSCQDEGREEKAEGQNKRTVQCRSTEERT